MSRWRKGQSGNPEGRPKGALNKSTREIREILDSGVNFERVVEKLQERALNGNEKAAEILLAYMYGKPVQRNDISLGDGSNSERDYSDDIENIKSKIRDLKVLRLEASKN